MHTVPSLHQESPHTWHPQQEEAGILLVSRARQSDLVLPETEFLPAERRHGGLHTGAVAHHSHLLHRQLLQRHVCLHAGKQHNGVSRIIDFFNMLLSLNGKTNSSIETYAEHNQKLHFLCIRFIL